MTNNDILRRLRSAFGFDESKIIALFALADYEVTADQLSGWLKKEDDAEYQNLSDLRLAIFLNGFITDRRGKKEGPQPEPEKRLTNNLIFRKLRIALNLTDEDVLEVLALADMSMSKHELSAFFRKPGHKNFRECKDQVLRNFITGLFSKYRNPGSTSKPKPSSKSTTSSAPTPWDKAVAKSKRQHKE